MSFFLVWLHKIVSFFSKQLFSQFLIKIFIFNMFSSPGLDLAFIIWWHHKPYLLLCDVTMLSILIENVVLKVLQEKMLITNVSITFLWAQSKKTSFWVPMTPLRHHKLLGQKYNLVQTVFYSVTHREWYSTVKPFSEENIWNSDLSITRFRSYR